MPRPTVDHRTPAAKTRRTPRLWVSLVYCLRSESIYLFATLTKWAIITRMSNKIVQKHPELGTRDFELVDDAIEYRIKSPFADEELSVVLSVLNPEPVIDGQMLYFLSEVNREALIKMFVDLPDAQTFEKFVSTVQQRIREEGFGKLNADNRKSEITKEQVDTTIRMLETNLDSSSIEALLSALRCLSEAPDNREYLNKVVEAFNGLGVQQGAVLSYTSFFNTLLSSTDWDGPS